MVLSHIIIPMKKGSIILFFFISFFSFTQKKFQVASIVFYNVENLYDTIKSVDMIDGTRDINDPLYHISVSADSLIKYPEREYKGELTFEKLKGKKVIRNQILNDEFTYNGPKLWNKKRYGLKLDNLAQVFTDIGVNYTKTAPVIIGMAEIENRQVLQDLVNHPKLKPFKYGISHFNSFDARGVDVALIYQSKRFKVVREARYQVDLFNDEGYRDYTRDILLVSGDLDGERMHFIVNHWPSRRGGEARSEPRRIKAAEKMREIIDEILKDEPNAKIICMGDFNDDPTNKSIRLIGTTKNKHAVKKGQFYNPMEVMYDKGMGTLGFADALNLFDQMLISEGLVNAPKNTYHYLRSEIFSPPYLINQEGPFKGYPFRSFSGDNFTGGYSDHYPVFTIIAREINEANP